MVQWDMIYHVFNTSIHILTLSFTLYGPLVNDGPIMVNNGERQQPRFHGVVQVHVEGEDFIASALRKFTKTESPGVHIQNR